MRAAPRDAIQRHHWMCHKHGISAVWQAAPTLLAGMSSKAGLDGWQEYQAGVRPSLCVQSFRDPRMSGISILLSMLSIRSLRKVTTAPAA
jgi:hypothetical protein